MKLVANWWQKATRPQLRLWVMPMPEDDPIGAEREELTGFDQGMRLSASRSVPRPTERPFSGSEVHCGSQCQWHCPLLKIRNLEASTVLASRETGTYSTRQGEYSGQRRRASVAQAVDLSVWHWVQGLGISYRSVAAGVMTSKVWARTKTPAMVVSILGMWQATHWLPGEPSLW